MRIWITEIGEPLPPDGRVRLMRCGLLAEELLARDHEVVWWSSTFDHARKVQRFPESRTLVMAEKYRIHLLHAAGYAGNHTLGRIWHHRAVAAAFRSRASAELVPDLLYCCVPTLEVAEEAVRYARLRNLATIVDVRDLWPDVYLDAVPRVLRVPARLILHGEFRRARNVFRRATAIVAVSAGYLDWALSYAGRRRGRWDLVVPHGYREGSIPAEEVQRARDQLLAMGVDPRRTICCFVGTFGHSYDLAPVISAARRMQEAGDARVQFVFAGDGERRSHWRAMAQGLQNVVFSGWLSSAGIAALLELSSVGIAAYVEGAAQGLPNKIFEYLSAGLPILSSLQGEAEALLRDAACGITYAPGDATRFAAALEPLLAAAETRRAMGGRGRAKFEADFRASDVYRALARHIEALITDAR
jgi:glycosyltransferase involved in cell wall biosynthesis